VIPDEDGVRLGHVRWYPQEPSIAEIAATLAAHLAQPEPGTDGDWLPFEGAERDHAEARGMTLSVSQRDGGNPSTIYNDAHALAAEMVDRHRAVIDHVADVTAAA
jgi:hypothetical protein